MIDGKIPMMYRSVPAGHSRADTYGPPDAHVPMLASSTMQ